MIYKKGQIKLSFLNEKLYYFMSVSYSHPQEQSKFCLNDLYHISL